MKKKKKEALDLNNSPGKNLIVCAFNVGKSDISPMLLMEGIYQNIKKVILGDNLLHFSKKEKSSFV